MTGCRWTSAGILESWDLRAAHFNELVHDVRSEN